ncbi:MAG: transporter substrate-binding domain-containing protein [Gammaproteobacteria bacterium]|nr:transporter substrate-binding domain-containing protein [Gammaproteobacteria bacterium]
MRLKYWMLILVLGASLLSASFSHASENSFTVTTSVGAPLYFEDGSGLYNLLVEEIFKRLNIEVKLVWLPSRRSLVSTNDGVDDGNIARTSAVEKKFPNLVRVPEKVFDFEFMAYSRDPSITLSDWKSLNPYVVGIINGWQIVERNVAGAKLVTRANDYEQLFNLLDKGRVEVAILDRAMGSWKLKQLGLDIFPIDPPIIKLPMFIYLNKKHESLVPGFARVLKDMKRDGTFAAIYEKALPDYGNP